MLFKLIVIRSRDIKILSEFYSLLGLNFEYHKHGNGVFHYSAKLGETVLEIYPLAKNQIEVDSNLRIGFEIENFDLVIENLKKININFMQESTETEFGISAIILDPENRKIELYKTKNNLNIQNKNL